MSIPAYLLNDAGCEHVICNGDCGKAVKINPETGRWYITMGHPGFNSNANNGDGYSAKRTAEAAIQRYVRA